MDFVLMAQLINFLSMRVLAKNSISTLIHFLQKIIIQLAYLQVTTEVTCVFFFIKALIE